MKEQVKGEATAPNISVLEAANSKTACVAWFKLADLITRKEKEKALNLYRLLSHSFANRAYALQIEGDILWSLEDVVALDKYRQAAFLYKKEKNLVAATAIYEHLLVLQPNNYDFLTTLIVLYILLSWPEKFEERYQLLLDQFDSGHFKEEQVFDFSESIVDFINGANIFLDEDAQVSSFSESREKELAWLLKSLQFLLKKKHSDFLMKLKIAS